MNKKYGVYICEGCGIGESLNIEKLSAVAEDEGYAVKTCPALCGQAGIELLRDQGLHYNPYEPLMYRELAWFFQHKMGANLDDAHLYYKQQWAEAMVKVFGEGRPNFDELIHPQTDEARRRFYAAAFTGPCGGLRFVGGHVSWCGSAG